MLRTTHSRARRVDSWARTLRTSVAARLPGVRPAIGLRRRKIAPYFAGGDPDSSFEASKGWEKTPSEAYEAWNGRTSPRWGRHPAEQPSRRSASARARAHRRQPASRPIAVGAQRARSHEHVPFRSAFQAEHGSLTPPFPHRPADRAREGAAGD